MKSVGKEDIYSGPLDWVSSKCYVGGKNYLFIYSRFFPLSGVPMFVLYVVGLPVMAWVGVKSVHKRAVVQGIHVTRLKGHATWGMFYSSFRQDAWWWEITVACRKIIIALIGVFGRKMGEMQVHFMALIMVVIIVLTMLFQPFGDRKKMHLLEIVTLVMTFATLWSGSVFNTHPKCLDENGKPLWWCNVISLVVGVGNIITVVFIVLFFLYTRFVTEKQTLHGSNTYQFGGGDLSAVAVANKEASSSEATPPTTVVQMTEMAALGFKNPRRTSSMLEDSSFKNPMRTSSMADSSTKKRESVFKSSIEVVT